MKNLLVGIACCLLISCQEKAKVKVEATLWGEGIISTEAPEFATSVNAAQTLVFFNRTTADRSSMKIMSASLEGNVWTDLRPLPFSTGKYRDVDPFLSHDGKRLYFSSNKPTETASTEAGQFNTWYVEKIDDGWSDPINPGSPLNSDSTEIFISMTLSGNAYFVSERDGRRGIVMSKFENGQYQEVDKIDLKLRGESLYASNPCIASDESFLIVASRDPQGNGTPDLFVCWNENGRWSEMINLGEAVNSPYAEFAPGLSKDDQTLYFSSERPGIVPVQEEGIRPPGDIYKVNIKEVLNRLKTTTP